MLNIIFNYVYVPDLLMSFAPAGGATVGESEIEVKFGIIFAAKWYHYYTI